MKVNKLMSALGASALALALMAGVTATPAMAADATAGIKFTKTINMTNAAGATVPTARYTYDITHGSAVAATANTPEIKAGVGTPTIGSAEFTYTDTIPENKLVTKDVTVNFNGVDFPTAGIYRYVITETDPTVAGLTTDGENTIYLDVYVTNGTGSRVVTYYQMTTSANAPTYVEGTKQPNYGSTKFTGDEDAYTTYQLTVTKNVEGTMADMTEKFDIDVDFTGLTEGTKVTVGETTQSGAATAGGTLSVSGELGDNDSIVIKGIPANAVYTVVENLSENEAYQVTYKIDDAETPSNASYAGTNGGEYTTANQQDMGANNHTVTVINTKNAVNPTGIILNVAPYALMVVIAVAGLVVFMRKRVED